MRPYSRDLRERIAAIVAIEAPSVGLSSLSARASSRTRVSGTTAGTARFPPFGPLADDRCNLGRSLEGVGGSTEAFGRPEKGPHTRLPQAGLVHLSAQRVRGCAPGGARRPAPGHPPRRWAIRRSRPAPRLGRALLHQGALRGGSRANGPQGLFDPRRPARADRSQEGFHLLAAQGLDQAPRRGRAGRGRHRGAVSRAAMPGRHPGPGCHAAVGAVPWGEMGPLGLSGDDQDAQRSALGPS